MGFLVGNIPWNKGKKCPNLANSWMIGEKASNWQGGKTCMDCKKEKGSYQSLRCQSCYSLYKKGDNNSNWKEGISKKYCLDCNKQLANYYAKYCQSCSKIGKRHWHWKGGVKSERRMLMNRKEYKLWRIAVFERDNYICQLCNQRGGDLHADHIKPFSLYPELRLAIDNGRALCVDCHRKTETYNPSFYKGFL